jgi:hypothetical protein
MATRLDNLAKLTSEGAGHAGPPQQIYDPRTREMLDGTRPPGRYLCVTAEHGHEENPDYVVVETLDAARERFDGELNGKRMWLPLALIDLTTGSDLSDAVGLHVAIETPDA